MVHENGDRLQQLGDKFGTGDTNVKERNGVNVKDHHHVGVNAALPWKRLTAQEM